MTDDTGSLQYASRSWILGRVSSNCTSQRAIDPFISRGQSGGSGRVDSQHDHPPTCFAVSMLSPLARSQVPAPRATFTGTPLLEVCSAKIGPRYFVLHQHFSRLGGGRREGGGGGGSEAPSPRASPCHLKNTEQLVFRVLGPRPFSPTQEFS